MKSKDNKDNHAKIKFKDNHANDFLDELWKKIEQGLLNAQKSDICEFLLYLLNKHAVVLEKNDFLHEYSPNELARILVSTPLKIKTIQNNIAFKFMDNNEYEDIFKDLIKKLGNKKIEIFESENKSKICFSLESREQKSILDEKLKKLGGAKYDFSFNSELVSIDKGKFLELLEKEVGSENIIKIVKNISKKDISIEKAKEWIQTACTLKDFVSIISDLKQFFS